VEHRRDRRTTTTIADEKRHNPMTRFASMSGFLRAMGGGRAAPDVTAGTPRGLPLAAP